MRAKGWLGSSYLLVLGLDPDFAYIYDSEQHHQCKEGRDKPGLQRPERHGTREGWDLTASAYTWSSV